MENSFGHHSDQDLVAVLDGVLDALTDERLRLESPQQRLGLAVAAVRVASRVSVWVQGLMAGVEADEVAVRVHGTSTTTWLAEAARLTPREARRLIRAGEGLARFGLVGEAARTGEVSATQAEAISAPRRHQRNPATPQSRPPPETPHPRPLPHPQTQLTDTPLERDPGASPGRRGPPTTEGPNPPAIGVSSSSTGCDAAGFGSAGVGR